MCTQFIYANSVYRVARQNKKIITIHMIDGIFLMECSIFNKVSPPIGVSPPVQRIFMEV